MVENLEKVEAMPVVHGCCMKEECVFPGPPPTEAAVLNEVPAKVDLLWPADMGLFWFGAGFMAVFPGDGSPLRPPSRCRVPAAAGGDIGDITDCAKMG